MLRNLQAKFSQSILLKDSMDDILFPTNRIKIHRNNIHANFNRVLNQTYPLTRKLLGDEYFKAITQEYTKQYPTYKGNLNDYGRHFPIFILNYVLKSSYINEVIRFEWLSYEIFFAADCLPFDLRILKSFHHLDYPYLRFTLNPACRLVKFNFPILKIIDLCRGIIDTTIDVNEGGVDLLIIRYHLDINLIELTQSEFNFLHTLQQGGTLSEALDTALSRDIKFPLEKKLIHWFKNKTLIGLHSHK